MKMYATLARAALLASMLVGTTAAYADFLVTTDSTQLGRLSRNNVPQDWSHFELNPATNGENYPGEINAATTYHYRTYYFNVGLSNFVQIELDAGPTTTFFSAYQTNYVSTNKALNWLGDAGNSGNYEFDLNPANFVDARYFQVVAALNSTLVVVVNEVSTNGGLNAANAFNLTVEGFSDSSYDDPVTLASVSPSARIPEPSTIALLAFAPIALVARRRTRKTASQGPSSLRQ